jgi:hypothetical protein
VRRSFSEGVEGIKTSKNDFAFSLSPRPPRSRVSKANGREIKAIQVFEKTGTQDVVNFKGSRQNLEACLFQKQIT